MKIETASWCFGLLTAAGLAASACGESSPPDPFDAGTGGRGSGSAPSDGGEGPGGSDPGLGGGSGNENECSPTSCEARESCDDSSGVVECSCAPGFEGSRCADVNECLAAEACGVGSLCVNEHGSHRCDCGRGYVASGEGCRDDDECAASPCAAGATCANRDGGYACSCAGGRVGDGLFCKSTPDCSGASCGGHGSCVETVGGYRCQCDAGYSGSTSCVACSELQLEATLEAQVRLLVGKRTGPLLPSDVAGFTVLDAGRLGLTSLAGLECWPDLETLRVANNELDASDLAVVASLGKLHTLVLDCNPIASLDGLAGHPSLRRLSVARSGPDCGAPLTDISALADLVGLEELDLTNQGLTSITSLTELRALRSLRLRGNSVTDPAALGNLQLLEELSLSNAGITDLSELPALPRLRALDLGYNSLTNFSRLASYARLESLGLEDTGIDDLTPLGGLGRLAELYLSDNDVEDLRPVAGLPRLTWLDVWGNRVTSLAPLVTAGRRGTLFVGDNPAACDAELAEERRHLEILERGGVEIFQGCVGD